MKTLTLLIALTIPVYGQTLEEMCSTNQTDITHTVCFSDNLKAPLDSLKIQWMLPHPPERYYAITVMMTMKDGVHALTVFPTSVLAGTIAHEVTHIAEYMKLNGEDRAQFTGDHTQRIYNLMLIKNIPFYTVLNGAKIALKN